jgi:uncharacterized membrane protein HdeD (DUF308 family)
MIAALVITNPFNFYIALALISWLGLGFLFAGIAYAAHGTTRSKIVGILGIIVGVYVSISPDHGLLLLAAALAIFAWESIMSGVLAAGSDSLVQELS